jgi:hypothetical protein
MASGSTSRLHVPYPVNSDTANIASDMEAIANYLDTNMIPYQQGATFSGTPVSGEFWWDTTAGTSYGLNYYDGTSWHTITASSNSFSGTAANRSSIVPSPVLGNFYWATDTTVLSFYTGAGWVVVGSTTVNGQDIAISTINTWQSVATLTPAANGLYQVIACFDVNSGTPTVGVHVLYADANGAQTLSIAPTGSSLSAGPWSSLPALISAHTGTSISLQVQASSTTGITASGFIEAV